MSEHRQLNWFKTEEREGKTYVFDPLRRRYVALTPEEEVRQRVLCLLVEHYGIPPGRLAVEYSLKVNGLDKRADAVVFDADGHPLMIVECKAPKVGIDVAVLEQALRYHSTLQPRFLLLSNGVATYCYRIDNADLLPMDHLPEYNEMIAFTQK